MVVPHHPNRADAEPAKHEHRLRIAHAERPQPIHFADHCGKHANGLNFGVTHQSTARSTAQRLRQNLRKFGPKAGNSFFPNGEARRRGMPPKRFQMLPTLPDPVTDVHRGDASGRAPAFPLLVHRNQYHRPVIALDQAARDNAHDTRMPGTGSQHNRLGRAARVVGAGCERVDGFSGDLFLNLLPLAVESIQHLGQSAGLILILGQQQLHRIGGISQPAGRIDARRQFEANVCDTTRSVNTGHGLQRLETEAASIGKPTQALSDHPSILSVQGCEVRDCCQCNQIQILFEKPDALTVFHGIGGRDLKRDTR